MKNLFYSSMFKDLKIDAVCHLAIRNRPDEKNPDIAHKLNLQGTRNLLDFSLESPTIKKFIFRSSHAVYRAEPMNPVFLDESADLNFDTTANRWIKDRVDAELLCRTKMDNPKFKIVILRFSNLVGRGVHQYMNTYINSRLPLHPMGFNPMVNLLHPRDAVRAIQLALEKDVSGVFNISGKETGPLREICRINGARSVPIPAGPLLKASYWLQRTLKMTDFHYEVDPHRLVYPILLDGSRAKTQLGYEPQTHVELG
jgi:UDP-glucose 4-epimerase